MDSSELRKEWPKVKRYYKWQMVHGYQISPDTFHGWLKVLIEEGKAHQHEANSKILSPLTVWYVFNEYGPPHIKSVFETNRV